MRNSNKRIIDSPITLVIALLLCIYLARAVWNIRKSATVAETKLEQAQSEYDRLQKQKTDLSTKIDYLSTPEGVETELRTKYRAVRPGESLAVIVDTTPTTTVATSTPSQGAWSRILQWFGFGR